MHFLPQKHQGANYLTLMISSFDGLLKYTTSLIIPKRPIKWRSINTASPFFESHVASMKEYEEILRTAGYTEKEEASIKFPEHIQEPDKTNLTILAAELLMAKLEVEQMNSVAVEQKQETTSSQNNICTSHTGTLWEDVA